MAKFGYYKYKMENNYNNAKKPRKTRKTKKFHVGQTVYAKCTDKQFMYYYGRIYPMTVTAILPNKQVVLTFDAYDKNHHNSSDVFDHKHVCKRKRFVDAKNPKVGDKVFYKTHRKMDNGYHSIVQALVTEIRGNVAKVEYHIIDRQKELARRTKHVNLNKLLRL